MKDFSQRGEQSYILDHFYKKGIEVGTFLDCGAYNGVMFSNTYALYLSGWKGLVIEPSPTVHHALDTLYGDTEIEIYKCALGDYDGVTTFYDSGGDAISSTERAHKELWERDYDCKFTQMEVDMMSIPTLLEKSAYKSFDFVSIDTEGTSLSILKQFDFDAMKTSLVCVEFDLQAEEVKDYLVPMGFNFIFQSPENVLYGR